MVPSIASSTRSPFKGALENPEAAAVSGLAGRGSANLNNGHAAVVVNAPNTPDTFQGKINGNWVDKDVSWHFSPKNGQHLPISWKPPAFAAKIKHQNGEGIFDLPCHGLETRQKQGMTAYEAIKEHIIATCIIVYPAFNKTNNIELHQNYSKFQSSLPVDPNFTQLHPNLISSHLSWKKKL